MPSRRSVTVRYLACRRVQVSRGCRTLLRHYITSLTCHCPGKLESWPRQRLRNISAPCQPWSIILYAGHREVSLRMTWRSCCDLVSRERRVEQWSRGGIVAVACARVVLRGKWIVLVGRVVRDRLVSVCLSVRACDELRLTSTLMSPFISIPEILEHSAVAGSSVND